MTDLEAPLAICDMCEVQIIRYVHTMSHPDYPGLLECGCVCAGNMEENLDEARARERRFRQRLARRERWLARPWRMSGSGNPYLNADGFNAVVFPRNGHWAARVEDRDTGYARFSRRIYPSIEAAKAAVFDVIFHPKLGLKAQKGKISV